jgi:hypothetical protein
MVKPIDVGRLRALVNRAMAGSEELAERCPSPHGEEYATEKAISHVFWALSCFLAGDNALLEWYAKRRAPTHG